MKRFAIMESFGVPIQSLNAELLAPGTHVGRLTLFTDSALDVLSQRNLFAQGGLK